MRDTNRSQPLLRLAPECGAAQRIEVVWQDLADDSGAIGRVIHDVVAQWGHLDVLVNNAGVIDTGPVEMVQDERWRRVIVFGAIACLHAILPHFRQRRSGCIIKISSVAGRIARAGMGPYAASKFAL